MADVAKIMSATIQPGSLHDSKTTSVGNVRFPRPPPRSHEVPKSLKPSSLAIVSDASRTMSVNAAALPPIVPTLSLPISNQASNSAISAAAQSSNKEKKSKGSTMVKVNKKYVLASSSRPAKRWTWAPFSSSARSDGLLLYHWVRAGVEYPDYPYARFNVHLQPLSYQDEETSTYVGTGAIKKITSDGVYESLGLVDQNWTQSETDVLLEMCRTYELRWPVIIDRWIEIFGGQTSKKVEDLQHRFYTIGMILDRKAVERAVKEEAENLARVISLSTVSSGEGPDQSASTLGYGVQPGPDRSLLAEHALAKAIVTSSNSANVKISSTIQPPIHRSSTGTSNQAVFDLQNERKRRVILEKQWRRSKEEELEEAELIKELNIVEAQIRKIKKNGGHLLASTVSLRQGDVGLGQMNTSALPTPSTSKVNSPMQVAVNDERPSSLDVVCVSFAPVPTSGTPYLQSGRLGVPTAGSQWEINKTTLKRMDQVLRELGIKDRPLPTKRVCDLYDHVRKDIITLLALQKIMLKSESDVVSKRTKLDKLVGNTVLGSVAGSSTITRVGNTTSKVANHSSPAKSTAKPAVVGSDGLSLKKKQGKTLFQQESVGVCASSVTKTPKQGTKRKTPSKKSTISVHASSDAEEALRDTVSLPFSRDQQTGSASNSVLLQPKSAPVTVHPISTSTGAIAVVGGTSLPAIPTPIKVSPQSSLPKERAHTKKRPKKSTELKAPLI